MFLVILTFIYEQMTVLVIFQIEQVLNFFLISNAESENKIKVGKLDQNFIKSEFY